MPLPDLGAADPEEFAELLGAAYAVALLLPPALTPRDHAHRRDVEGTEAALWIAAGVDPNYVVGWLQGEAARLQESLDAPIAPPEPERYVPDDGDREWARQTMNRLEDPGT